MKYTEQEIFEAITEKLIYGRGLPNEAYQVTLSLTKLAAFLAKVLSE